MAGLLARFRSPELARIPIPGEAVATLPEGTVKIRFEQDRGGWRLREGAELPSGVEVEVAPAGGGQPLEVRPSTAGSPMATRKVLSIPYAVVEVPAAGEYRISSPAGVGRTDPFLVFRA
jgi:hypothetical protein